MEKTTAEICRDKGLNFDVISNKALDVGMPILLVS